MLKNIYFVLLVILIILTIVTIFEVISKTKKIISLKRKNQILEFKILEKLVDDSEVLHNR